MGQTGKESLLLSGEKPYKYRDWRGGKMGKKKIERMVSFDLLRIISMLLIIAYHWQLHAYADGICSASLSGNQIISFAAGPWGTMGGTCFL